MIIFPFLSTLTSFKRPLTVTSLNFFIKPTNLDFPPTFRTIITLSLTIKYNTILKVITAIDTLGEQRDTTVTVNYTDGVNVWRTAFSSDDDEDGIYDNVDTLPTVRCSCHVNCNQEPAVESRLAPASILVGGIMNSWTMCSRHLRACQVVDLN